MSVETKERHYKIIRSDSCTVFGKKVTRELNNGWEPWGAPFVSIEGETYYNQAMIRFVKE